MNPSVRSGYTEPSYDSWREAAELARQSPPTLNPPAVVAAPLVPQRSLHVLCIDDDEQLLEVMKDCLTQFKHRVQGASGGKYGIEQFRIAMLKSDPYDVVITDMNMPDVNGCAVARAIKADCPDVPVIMVTGMGASLSDAEFTSVPLDAMVEKPLHMQELHDLLLRIARPA
jgi:CheY-like chemotaxis protein